MNYRSGNSFAQGAATGLRIIGGMVDLLERREDRERTYKREDRLDVEHTDDRRYRDTVTRPQQEARAKTDQEVSDFGLRSSKAKFNEWELGAPNREAKRRIEGRKYDVWGNLIPLWGEAEKSKLNTAINQGKKSTLDLEKTQKTQKKTIAGINAGSDVKVDAADVSKKTKESRIRAIEAGADVTESQANVASGTEEAQITTAKATALAGVAKADTLEDEGSKTRYKLKDGGKVTKAKLIKEFKATTRLSKDEMGISVYVDIETGEPVTFREWANERLETPLPEIKNPKKKARTLSKDRTKALERFVIN